MWFIIPRIMASAEMPSLPQFRSYKSDKADKIEFRKEERNPKFRVINPFMVMTSEYELWILMLIQI